MRLASSDDERMAASVKDRDPQCSATNWEARVKKEMDSPQSWHETWGTYFNPPVPTGYDDRIEFLERELETMKDVGRPFKYGVAAPLQGLKFNDHRRKKITTL